jgi:transcriptional regulator with XRE-family HTH domain
MVRNEEKYQQAIQFRARGFTLAEIAKICEVSKGTVSKWLKNNPISENITTQNKRRAGKENAKRLQLMTKARGKERAIRYAETERGAEVDFKHYKNDPRFIAGLLTYAALGDMDVNGNIRIASSRMESHRVVIMFLIEYLGVSKSKIKFWLLLYPSHNEEICMKKWHKITSIPYAQFHQNQILKSNPKHKTLHHGVGNTIIGNTVLKRKLIRWIKLMQKELTAK